MPYIVRTDFNACVVDTLAEARKIYLEYLSYGGEAVIEEVGRVRNQPELVLCSWESHD